MVTSDLPSMPAAGARKRSHPEGRPRALKILEWPCSDQDEWQQACIPARRLSRGGAASHLAQVSQNDFANRYGLYLDYLKRTGLLDLTKGAADLVTPGNVAGFIAELQGRVRSVTVWNSVYKLRRAAELITPKTDFAWLREIENDLASEMIPRSKADRVVLAERLVEAGLTLIQEAEMFGETSLARAVGIRNGLLIVLLGLHPIRIKNYATLAIGDSFINLNGHWWLRILSKDAKTHRIDQRQVPEFVTHLVDRYIEVHRPILSRNDTAQNALWISSTTGRRMTTKNLGILISKLTRETLGVDVSPHLFRTCAASTAAIHASNIPHLATALLNHRDPRIAGDRYDHAMDLSAGEEYGRITQLYRRQ
jgi:site-specific recombinase XerD